MVIVKCEVEAEGQPKTESGKGEGAKKAKKHALALESYLDVVVSCMTMRVWTWVMLSPQTYDKGNTEGRSLYMKFLL